MKTYFLITLLFFASSVMAQSLKDSLYKGKLKNPLSQAVAAKDSAKAEAVKKDSAAVAPAEQTQPAATPAEALKPDDTMPDSLNRLYYAKQKSWKRFIEGNRLIVTQQADESKKVKRGEYSIDIDYEIGLNGRVKATNIACYPQNDFLKEQVTEFMSRVPVLAPPVYGDGKPRVAVGKENIIILKK